MTTEQFINIATLNNFNVSEPCEQNGSFYIELQQDTPAGEDWYETLWYKDPDDILKNLYERISDWDSDDEAEIWIDGRGKNGVPSSIRVLLDDQDWKLEQLEALYNTCRDHDTHLYTEQYLDCTLYRVETDENDNKQVHLLGYCNEGDNGFYNLVTLKTAADSYISVSELTWEKAYDVFDNAKQYDDEVDVDGLRKYYTGAVELLFADVDEYTPDGLYVDFKSND